MRLGIRSIAALGLQTASSPHPTNDDLEAEFLEHRNAFDTLADMAVADGDYSRISHDFIHPRWELPEKDRPGDPIAARWEANRQAFDDLNLESGVTNCENAVVVLEQSSSGLMTSGSSVGFMRAAELPTSIELLDNGSELECSLGDKGSCWAARKLSDNWYMIIERH